MNIAQLNSITLNGGLLNNTGFNDLQAFISVNTNPALATFAELQAFITVGTQAFLEPIGNITVSNYKWLTNTLLTAQQSPGMTPYFSLKIVDDTITPQTIISPPGVPGKGQLITAPDGNILAVGNDGTGKLAFWKITNPDGSQWATPTATLASSYLTAFNATIAVSPYIAGTYAIDIYYAVNVAGNISIVNQHSTDGGSTWSSTITTNAPGLSASTTDNFYLAAVAPSLQADGTINRTFFYILKNGSGYYDVWYQYYTGSGGSFSSAVSWLNTVNPQDMIIHSLDAYKASSGTIHLVISAYHLYQEDVVNANFGIYIFSLTNFTNGVNDVWTSMRTVFSSTSASTANMNVFTFPRITYDGSFYRILFKAVIVDSVQQSVTSSTTNIVTTTYYYLCQAKEFKNFSYPAPLMFTDGTVFTDNNAYSFVLFGTTNYYVGGNGVLWKYLLNNTTADVTNSIINYEVDEEAGSAAQITVTIANQNNQWFGTSPTQPGYAAISKNKKIYLDQGYKTTVGNESVPRNIFFIDDIQQQVNSNTNDLVITGRDSFKNLIVFTTKFAYTFSGVKYYNDIFNSTGISDWNQISGSWQEVGSGSTFFAIEPSVLPVSDAIITHQIEEPNNSAEAYYLVYASFPSTGINGEALYIFPYYQDVNNNLLFKITTISGTLTAAIIATQGGVANTILSGQSLSASYSSQIIPILIHRYNYSNYMFILGSTALNKVASLDPNVTTGGITPMMFTVSGASVNVSGTWQVRNSVFAMGCVNYSANFSFFRHIEYADSQSIQDIVEKVGGLSAINNYNRGYSYVDTLFDHASYVSNNPYTYQNGYAVIPPSTTMMNTVFTLSNNEVEFKARMLPTVVATGSSMNFFFRTNTATTGFTLGYIFNVANTPSQPNTSARIKFRDTSQGGDFLFHSSTSSDFIPGGTFLNNLGFDLTQWHTYRLVAFDGWIFGFIDEKLAISWYDDHTNAGGAYAAQLSGSIGFGTDSNTTLEVQYIRSRTLWNQIQNTTFNPGDDATATLQNLVGTIKAWNYNNLMGQFSGKILSPTEASVYTYNTIIIQTTVDDSDKEYVNQVTVYGTSVQATYQDKASIANTGRVREMTIIDYKITTYQDALTRAQNEMNAQNMYNGQNTPEFPNNVGSEIFDVNTIVNTGINSAGTNGNFRVYNEVIKNAGSNGFYGIELQTGTL